MHYDSAWFLKSNPDCVILSFNYLYQWKLIDIYWKTDKNFPPQITLLLPPIEFIPCICDHKTGEGILTFFPLLKRKPNWSSGFFQSLSLGSLVGENLLYTWAPHLKEERHRYVGEDLGPSRVPRRPLPFVHAPPAGEAPGPQLPGSAASRSGWLRWDPHRFPGAAARSPLAPAPRRWPGPRRRHHHRACPCPPRAFRRPQTQTDRDNPPLAVSVATLPCSPPRLGAVSPPWESSGQLQPSFAVLLSPWRSLQCRATRG